MRTLFLTCEDFGLFFNQRSWNVFAFSFLSQIELEFSWYVWDLKASLDEFVLRVVKRGLFYWLYYVGLFWAEDGWWGRKFYESIIRNCWEAQFMFFKGREREEIVEEGEVSAGRVPFFTWLSKGQWVHCWSLPIGMAIEASSA